jgi:hypothetical protein
MKRVRAPADLLLAHQRMTSAALEVWYPRVAMSLISDPVDEATNEKPRRSGASKDGSDGRATRVWHRVEIRL